MTHSAPTFGLGDTALVCPHCHNDWLHHFDVKVFWREGEDSKNGLVVETRPGHLKTDSTGNCQRRNPSPRRDGLTIDFACENCTSLVTLSIYQHKGQTFSEWSYACYGDELAEIWQKILASLGDTEKRRLLAQHASLVLLDQNQLVVAAATGWAGPVEECRDILAPAILRALGSPRQLTLQPCPIQP